MLVFSSFAEEDQRWNQDSSWFVGQSAPDSGYVDVFYLVSTNVVSERDKDGNISYQASLSQEEIDILSKEMRHMAGKVFSDSVNFFSPYYHQYTMEVLGLEKDRFSSVFKNVLSEVYDAFTYYYDNINCGRPFVIAGFSQGAQLTTELVKMLTEEQMSQLVAAYVLGWGINDKDMESSNIVPAEGAFDKKVTVSFNSVNDIKNKWEAVMNNASYCINPVNWRTDSTPAEFEYKGQTLSVHLDPLNHLLVVSGFDGPTTPFVAPWPEGNYHFYEIQFYNNFLRQNIKDRAYR